VRRQLTTDDYAMVFQWIAVLALAPFVLLPIFPRPLVHFSIRLSIVLGALAASGVVTLIYLWARRKSRQAAATVATATAGLDVLLVFVSLFLWPKVIPEIFWILTILVIVISARFSYREAAVAALGFSAVYMISIGVGYGSSLNNTVFGDALIRVVLMMMIAVATAYVTQREKNQRKEARILSRLATAMGSTLDTDELMNTVVDGISEAAGMGRCTAFLISADGRWAIPKSTTEKDPLLREKLFKLRISFRNDDIARRVFETREPMIVTDAGSEPLLDREWVEDFGLSTMLVLPIVIRNDVKGAVVVDRRGIRRYYTDHEVDLCQAIVAQAAVGLEHAARYAEEQRKRSESELLYRTSRELGSTLEMEGVLENACRIAISSTGGSGCAAFLCDEKKGVLAPRLLLGGGAKRTSFPPESAIPSSEFEEIYRLAQRPPALSMRNPSDYPFLPDFLRSAGSILIAPFFMHGSIGGILCITDPEEAQFDRSRDWQLAVVASEVALAVINARLHERIKADAAQMASLVQLANAIGSSAELATVMRLALDSVKHLFDCSSGLIYRIDEKDGTMRCVESFGYSEETFKRISSAPYPRVEECWTVSEGCLIGVDDLSETKVDCRTLEKIGQGSTMCVGMKSEGRTLGVLHVRSERPNAFGEEDQQLALAFADQVGLALQRALLFEEINRLAMTDPLTGVFNVRRLESVLTDEVNRARRYKRPVSFLMVDVDNLKAYNDTLGHQQGDIVLSQVASIIDSSTRDVDKVFRYGGDEFCVILPETDSEEAAVVADKIRRSVADFHFAGEEKIPDGSITISVGVAAFPRDSEEEWALIHKADLALYAAKQIGRNSVSTAF
jgi:diguanylate cyclase (GGDEF)-like protein